jgi:hypothetical protein
MTSEVKSAQGSRVALELEALREKQLAKSQREKLKDCKLERIHIGNEINAD